RTPAEPALRERPFALYAARRSTRDDCPPTLARLPAVAAGCRLCLATRTSYPFASLLASCGLVWAGSPVRPWPSGPCTLHRRPPDRPATAPCAGLASSACPPSDLRGRGPSSSLIRSAYRIRRRKPAAPARTRP